MAQHTNTIAVRFTLFVLALVAVGTNISVPAPAPVRTSEIAVVAKPADDFDPAGIYGASSEFAAEIEAAVDRFDSAGLALPELRIYVHSDSEGCLGMSGLFNRDGSGTRVDMCTEVTYTLLHELAHAWEYQTMDDATRQAYLDETGLPTWSDHDFAWDERGIENAATAIAWGLLDIPIQNPAAFVDELRHFELLTGITSPRLQGS